MWALSGPGIESGSPGLAGGFLSTIPPGKSLFCCFLACIVPYKQLLSSLSFFLCKKDFSKISGPAYMWVICTGIVPVPDSVPTSTYSFLPPNFCPKIPLTFISNRIILSAYLQAECLDPNKIQSSHKECLKWCSNYLAQDCQLWGLWIIPPHRKLYFTLTSVWSLFQPISEFLLKGMLPYKYKPQKAKNL